MNAFVRVKNLDRGSADPARVEVCDGFLTRLRGLMFRRRLSADEGALLVGGRDPRADATIHMFFVRFDLAVFWISSELEVVDKVVARTWRPAYIPKRPARYVLEMHPDHYPDYEIGNKVRIIDA